MQGYFVIVSLVIMVLGVGLRSAKMNRAGIRAVHFGELDKKDFLIPPFVILYFYLILANTFQLPKFDYLLVNEPIAAWVGTFFCLFAPVLFLWGILSFGQSFRVGIDEKKPGELITSGAFAVSRNPLYAAFVMFLIGVFLTFPTWIFFAYFVVGLWLIDRQVCLEESALRKIYGNKYDEYCNNTRRYI